MLLLDLIANLDPCLGASEERMSEVGRWVEERGGERERERGCVCV